MRAEGRDATAAFSTANCLRVTKDANKEYTQAESTQEKTPDPQLSCHIGLPSRHEVARNGRLTGR